jgi:energy-coupling factor transport system ATP-binding protein
MRNFVLKEITLSIGPGECHCVTGPTGTGKTTLLLAIRGLLPEGRRRGSVIFNGGGEKASGAAGLVLQNPETQLLGTSLGAEVAFGLENHCVPPGQMPGHVRAALAKVGLDRPLGMAVDSLSMGQQYRALLAGVLVTDPPLLLLDEPCAQLDPRGLEKLVSVIRTLKRSGKSLLICDHRPASLAPVLDACWRIDRSGRFQPAPTPPTAGRMDVRTGGSVCGAADGAPAVIRAAGLGMAAPDGTPLWSGLSFSVARGERIAVCGPNGAGKTSLVRCLAGLSTPAAGTLSVLGKDPRALCGKIRLLHQNPQRQLFETTVFAEVAFAAKRLAEGIEDMEGHVGGILSRLGIDHLSGASPHKLSFGQKHLVALASVLAGAPEILILDDPFAGLNRENVDRVTELLAELGRGGTTIVWTAHSPGMPARWPSRVLRLEAFQASADTGARSIPSGAPATQGDLRPVITAPAGPFMLLSIALSATAFAARTLLPLALLTAINLALLGLTCPRPIQVLRRSLGFLFSQTAIITVLYALRFGIAAGAPSGGRVGWQLFLAFWPGMIFMASTSQPRIIRALSKVLPHRTAFVIAVCLKFLPMLMHEVLRIRECQRLRGAHLAVGDLRHPPRWPDWVRCLLVPALVHTLSLSGDIALAAEARAFGLHRRRTCWPGD